MWIVVWRRYEDSTIALMKHGIFEKAGPSTMMEFSSVHVSNMNNPGYVSPIKWRSFFQTWVILVSLPISARQGIMYIVIIIPCFNDSSRIFSLVLWNLDLSLIVHPSTTESTKQPTVVTSKICKGKSSLLLLLLIVSNMYTPLVVQ